MVLIIGLRIYCANIGDSRAILCRQRESTWVCEPLSRDHKPDDPEVKDLERGRNKKKII